MTMSDPIADMLTRIRNASRARHPSCDMPYSRIKGAIAEVLRDEGYIDSFEERGEGIQHVLRVYLRYAPGGRGRDPILMGIERISKPGLRVYAKATGLPKVLGGLGIAIISTSQGLLTDRQANQKGVGGEVLAYVW